MLAQKKAFRDRFINQTFKLNIPMTRKRGGVKLLIGYKLNTQNKKWLQHTTS